MSDGHGTTRDHKRSGSNAATTWTLDEWYFWTKDDINIRERRTIETRNDGGDTTTDNEHLNKNVTTSIRSTPKGLNGGNYQN